MCAPEPTDFELRHFELTHPELTPMPAAPEDQTNGSVRWKILLAGVVALALLDVLIPLWSLRL